MTNEEIILEKISSVRVGKTPLKFSIGSRDDYWSLQQYQASTEHLEEKIKYLKSIKDITMRVDEIIDLAESYKTYTEDGKFQCGACCRRSTVDIWRIYVHYFGETDIFSVMRALYDLVMDNDLNTYRCPDIQKRVFWYDEDNSEADLDVKAELGVEIREWKEIGNGISTI